MGGGGFSSTLKVEVCFSKSGMTSLPGEGPSTFVAGRVSCVCRNCTLCADSLLVGGGGSDLSSSCFIVCVIHSSALRLSSFGGGDVCCVCKVELS